MKTTVFKFDPDKRAEDSPLTNGQRAENAFRCIRHVFDFAQNDRETAVVDTLANIFHFCDENGIDVLDALKTARMHWDAERGEPSGLPLDETASVEQTIVIHVCEGRVDDVISEVPLNYIIADEDVEGSDEEDICTPPESFKNITHAEEIFKVRHCQPATVSTTAVADMVKLHENVRGE